MDNATITANALVKWMPRLLLVADGASFRANPQADSDRLASESMSRAVERLRDEGKVQ
jgi:hypothetical protein